MNDHDEDDYRSADAADRAAAQIELAAFGRAQQQSRKQLVVSGVCAGGAVFLAMTFWSLAAVSASVLFTPLLIVIGLVPAYVAYQCYRETYRHWLGPDPVEWFGSEDDLMDVLARTSPEWMRD